MSKSKGKGGDRRVCRGQVVEWEGKLYRVLRRRAVDWRADLAAIGVAPVSGLPVQALSIPPQANRWSPMTPS